MNLTSQNCKTFKVKRSYLQSLVLCIPWLCIQSINLINSIMAERFDKNCSIFLLKGTPPYFLLRLAGQAAGVINISNCQLYRLHWSPGTAWTQSCIQEESSIRNLRFCKHCLREKVDGQTPHMGHPTNCTWANGRGVTGPCDRHVTRLLWVTEMLRLLQSLVHTMYSSWSKTQPLGLVFGIE